MKKSNVIKLHLKGLGCANCANKIEVATTKLKEVEAATLNFGMAQLTIQLKDKAEKEIVMKAVKEIVYRLEPHVKVEEIDSPVEKQRLSLKNKSLERIKENKWLLLGSGVFALATFFQVGFWGYLIAYFLIGGKVLLTALRNLRRGEIFDENFLMSIATIGAFVLREYPEAIAVMLFYEIGELFQHAAVNRSRQSISELLDLRVDSAHLVTGSGISQVSIETIKLEDVILIKPGERVPLDGVIISGESELDTSALTGETRLSMVSINDEILSGTINTSGVIKIKVTSTSRTSTVAKILDLVENASTKKATTERFITKFCRFYTPTVVGIALVVALIPPLFFGGAFDIWIYRALVFLVVSCPCALVVSIPLGFFAGIGGASKQGVLVKGANYLEMLSQIQTVVFDKTGTLTKGNFIVNKIKTNQLDEQTFLKLAAYGESQSNHPIAKSIVKAYGGEIIENHLTSYEEIAGKGIRVHVQDKQLIIGNAALMAEYNIPTFEVTETGTLIYMLVDGEYKGYMVITDEIKKTSKETISELKKAGIKRVIMLTGDNENIAKTVASELGIDEVYAELLPHQKVEEVEKLLTDMDPKTRLAFVGDGINDAPVLARADIGVAMGGMGSDAAIEAADVVLMKDDPMALIAAIRQSKKTNRILKQNIFAALGLKFLIMILSVFGLANMWLAIFADVGITLLTVVNSIRALRK